MNYGRDYGNRNFVERAAHTVRGWFGGDHYDRDYGGRGGGGMYGGDRQRGGWGGGENYREMGNVGGGGWRGHAPMGQGNRSDFDSYRAGGYRPDHGDWDVDWDRQGGGGMNRGGPSGGGMNRGGMGRGMMGGAMPAGGYTDHDRYASRDFMTNQGYYDAHGGYRDEMDDPGYRGGRGGMGGYAGEMGRGGMERGDMNRGGMNRGGMGRGMQGGGRDFGYGGAGTHDLNDADMGDHGGGTIGNYGPYSSYGIQRFRTNNNGGMQPGQYYTGYGVGTGYR